jgi:hypothetical protein
MIKKECLPIIQKLYEAIEECEKLECKCNKYSEHTCNKHTLINELTNQIKNVEEITNREE